MRRGLRIAIGQVPVVMGDKRGNVLALIEAAETARADLLVLPECSFAGWLSPAARAAAEPIPGPFTRTLSRLAARRRMGIVVGFEERDAGRIYNSAVLIDKAGRLLLHHRKINELELGRSTYGRGSSLRVAEFEGRRVALSICADSWEAPVTDALWAMGAELILSPCAWAVDPGGEATNIAWIRETYRARVRDRKLTIVSANGVGPVTQGPWKGRLLQGDSLITGPDGKTLLQGPTHRPVTLAYVIK